MGRLGRFGAAMFYLLPLTIVVYLCAHAHFFRGLPIFKIVHKQPVETSA
jgi:hypothetical protein